MVSCFEYLIAFERESNYARPQSFALHLVMMYDRKVNSVIPLTKTL